MIDENKEKLSNIQSEIDANAAALEKAKEVERIQQEQAEIIIFLQRAETS